MKEAPMAATKDFNCLRNGGTAVLVAQFAKEVVHDAYRKRKDQM